MSYENVKQNLDDSVQNQMLQGFFEEVREHLDTLNLKLIQLEETPEDEEIIDQIFRMVHTIKGSAGFAGLTQISEISRRLEGVFGDVRKGTFKVTSSLIEVMYAALDILSALMKKAEENDASEMDVSLLFKRLDRIPENMPTEIEELPDCREMLRLYKKSYDQLAVLKHLAYSSVHLSDAESLAVLFSKQIDEKMPPKRNSCWLVNDKRQAVETARDGELVEKNQRRVLAIDSSDVLKRVVYDQVVVWPSSIPNIQEMLPGYDSPVIFPIKSKPEAYGFLVLDPYQLTEVELYQFVSQFAAMIIKISKLHQKVDQQRKELDEMTGILFRQNAHLSSLYHVELDLMKVTDPVEICRIVVDAVVNDLEANRAAAFLVDETSKELVGAYASGGFEGIDTLRLPIEQETPIKQAYESGRVVTCIDYPEEVHLGSNLLENWIVSVFKGRERVQGILVVEAAEEGDLTDPISILANYSGILLDTLTLQSRGGN